jgi:hypothetical protein
MTTSFEAIAGSRGKAGKLSYVLTSEEVSQFVVPLRGQMQTNLRVENPNAVTPSTGGAISIFIPRLWPDKAMLN